MNKKISLLILSTILIIGAGVFYYMTQYKKGVAPKKEVAQKATPINYKGAMVINKVTSISEVMGELNKEAPASGGTFDLKTMAKTITAEALKAFSDSKEKSLPLVASWNTGIPTYIKAMDPMYMISRIENGEHILVSWKLDPYYDETIGYDYYEESIKKAAELGLPLVFVVPAPESALSLDSTFLNMDAKENPNVVNAKGEILNKLSPFGPDKNWEDVGEMWASSDMMAQIQEWYPNPPLVVFVSENRSDKLTWKEIETDTRYTLKNRDDNFKRTLINAQWIEKYRQLHEGFKTAFTKTAWKENVKFITRDELSMDMGANKNWIDNATVTNLYANIWPLTADGVNVDFTLQGTDTSIDGPHVLVNNLPFMLNEAKTINPLSASQLSINADSIVDNPARYRGLTQFALWFLRPNFVRQDSALTQREELQKAFQEVSDSVELIHYNSQLTDFWRNGTLVKNGTSDLNTNIPTQYENDPRWFLLDTDANPKRPWTSDTAINVWAFALVEGEAPDREWLLYVQSPDGNKTDVTVSVPGYKDVLVDSTAKGSFIILNESADVPVKVLSQSEITNLETRNNSKLSNVEAIKTLNYTETPTQLKTVKQDKLLKVPNKDGSWDFLQIYMEQYGGDNEIVLVDTGNQEIKHFKQKRYMQWHLATSVIAPNGKMYINTLSKSQQVINIYNPETNDLKLNAIKLPESLGGEYHPMTLGTDRNIYIGGSFYGTGKAQIVKLNPNTNEITDFGEMGPSHGDRGIWATNICSDDKYTYITSGKIPWYLIAYNRESETQTTLYEGDEIRLTQHRYGCSVKTSDKKMYYLYDNKMISAPNGIEDIAPWPIPNGETHANTIKQSTESPLLPKGYVKVESLYDNGIGTLWRFQNNKWNPYQYSVDTYPQQIFRIKALPNNLIFGSGVNKTGFFLYNTETNETKFLGTIGLSHYTTSISNHIMYLSGYPSAALYKIDLNKDWSKPWNPTKKRVPADDPSRNPKFIDYLKKTSGAHKMYASVVGADGNIYFGGTWYRDGKGGGLSWYNPQTGLQDGIYKIFSNYTIRYMTTINQGKQIVISTMGVQDNVLHKEKPSSGRIFIFDTKSKTIIKTIDTFNGSLSSGVIQSVDDAKIIGMITIGKYNKKKTYLYYLNVKTSEIIYQIEINAGSYLNIGDNESRADIFIKGPKGFIWTVLNKNITKESILVKINPHSGAIDTIGLLPPEKYISSLQFVNDKLFGIADSSKIVKIDIQ